MAGVSWLLDWLGAYLLVHARPADTKSQLQRALAIYEAAYGPDHPAVATDLNNNVHPTWAAECCGLPEIPRARASGVVRHVYVWR